MPITLSTVFYAIYYAAVILVCYENYRKAKNAGKKKAGKADDSQGHLINKRSNQEPIPLIYGRVRVGINEAYVGVSGSENNKLHIIGIIGEGEINGIAQTDGVDQLFIDGRIYTEFGSLIHYEIFTGTSTQNVCATLHAAIPEWNDPLRYTAYIYISIERDNDAFQGKPDITLEVEGLKVYNPDTEATEYSNNPALEARDFVTRSSRRGGQSIATSRILDSSFTNSETYCTAKGFTCNLPIIENKECVDNLREILDTFRGGFIYSENKYKLLYADLNYETACMSLDDNDIVSREGRSTMKLTQPSVYDTPNAIRIKFLNKDNKYLLDDYVKPDPDAIAADGDYREETVTIRGITLYANVMKMANYLLEKERINKGASFEAHGRCRELEPFDVIKLTSIPKGWVDKYFRVALASSDGDANAALDLTEEEESFYDDTYNLAEHNWHDTTLPSPSDAVPSVAGVSQSEEVYNYRDRSFTRWKINFSGPAAADYPFWDHADIHVKIGVDGEWKFMTKSTGDYQLDPVAEGVTYFCTMVSVSIFGAKQAWNDAHTISHTIIGKTALPGDLTGLTAIPAGDAITLFAEPLTDPDIAVYELRMGDAWEGGLYIASNESPNWRLVGVRPGVHTFWAKAKDNAGNYSENAVSAVVKVFYPSGYTDKNTWAWDFDGIGAHANTEHTTYESSDALKCSHTGDVLTGTWLSPEYDLGSVKKVRLWGDFITAFESGAGLWSAVIPAGATWADVFTATAKWYEILSPEFAGALSAKLLWGTSPGSLINEADKLELLGIEIEARYVQVEITITDPDIGSNLYLKTLNMVAAYWS
jgi:hypothetical protein